MWIRTSNPANHNTIIVNNTVLYIITSMNINIFANLVQRLLEVIPLHRHWQQHPLSQLSLHKFRHKQLLFR